MGQINFGVIIIEDALWIFHCIKFKIRGKKKEREMRKGRGLTHYPIPNLPMNFMRLIKDTWGADYSLEDPLTRNNSLCYCICILYIYV